ncbi:MAG: hydroxyethylthiazole kinase [Clostridium sp.]|uniref:hydroxyethylthiazole kinase n=1 Tax=Clostridium sp. TaxID=1506 RepID=UPI003F35EAC9
MGLVKNLREKNPLVLHYTNEVTINDCANITLAIGGSPLMSYSKEEAEELVSISSAVVINIGTMNSERLELFLEVAKLGNKYNKPVVLDPVGVFATKARKEFVDKLLSEANFTVIKGNLAEIKSLAGLEFEGKGVDSEDGEINVEVLRRIAEKLNTTIALTGKIDYIADKENIIKVYNGVKMLKGITGTGCMTASLIGAYLGSGLNSFDSAKLGVLTMGIAGEKSYKDNIGLGSFRVSLIDNISKFNDEVLEENMKIGGGF